MKGLLFYGAMGLVILWRLPKLRQGESRWLTLTWVILWVITGALAGIWIWGPEDWRLAELIFPH